MFTSVPFKIVQSNNCVQVTILFLSFLFHFFSNLYQAIFPPRSTNTIVSLSFRHVWKLWTEELLSSYWSTSQTWGNSSWRTEKNSEKVFLSWRIADASSVVVHYETLYEMKRSILAFRRPLSFTNHYVKRIMPKSDWYCIFWTGISIYEHYL